MRLFNCLFLLCTTSFASSVIAQDQFIQVTDMLKIRRPDNVTVTKDGTKAAFVLNSIIPDPSSKADYKYINQLYVVTTDGNGTPKQLTASPEGAGQPAWSPDGKKLAFVRVADGKPQVFILSMEGGEPIQLTKFRYGATAPQWSPDGKQIVFRAGISLKELIKDSLVNPKKELPLWSMEIPGLSNEASQQISAKADPNGSIDEIRAWLINNEKDKKAVVMNNLNFIAEAGISGETDFQHLFIVSADSNAVPKPITRGFGSFGNFYFTPDGKSLIVGGHVDSLKHPDHSIDNEIYLVNTDGTGFKKLLGDTGMTYQNPSLSSSGKWLAFQYYKTWEIGTPDFAVVPLNGSEKDIVKIAFDRTPAKQVWSRDDKFLYFTAPSNGGVPVYRLDIKTKKVEQLSDYNAGVLSFDLAGDKIVFVKTQVTAPGDVYQAGIDMKNVKAISQFNTWVQNKKLSLPEKKSFVNEKGLTVEYWVMKPLNFEAGKKYPVVLNIHGGPTAMWGPGEASMWHEFQYFAGKGYGIVYGNPRGSGGYGKAFLQGNFKDWGKGPSGDVLTYLDKAVGEGWIDTSKMVITGGSYAGYLTAWIVGHDKRFKAASAQRGVYDLSTFFGEGNAWRLVPGYFMGYPWQPETKKMIDSESPITYVSDITTPLLIFHGSNDLRTGVTQSEMLYKSLKVLGRPVEYVRHPGATHELVRTGDNRQRIDQMLRTYEFFQRYIK